MGAIVKMKGFDFEKSLAMAIDPNWSAIMLAKLWEMNANDKLKYNKDGSVDFSLSEFDLAAIEDLIGKGLQIEGLLKVAIETVPAKAEADVPAYIDDKDYPVMDTRQAKDGEGKLLFEVITDLDTGEESQGDPITESFDTGETTKKTWKEISSPQIRNDGKKVIMFPSLTLDQYSRLKSETGIVVKSLKDWETMKQDSTLTGYEIKQV